MYAEPVIRNRQENETNLTDTLVDLAQITYSAGKAVVTAPFRLISYFWSETKTETSSPTYHSPYTQQRWKEDLKSSIYYQKLHLYLEYSMYSRLNEEQKLIICAAVSSVPSDDNPGDDENKRKILIALLASILLTGGGIAIVCYTGSNGVLSTLLVETGTAGINHCLESARTNKKFLWKEWSNEIISTGIETIILMGLNKARKYLPIKLRGKIDSRILKAFGNVYDQIESYSGLIVYVLKTDELDSYEFAYEVLKCLDDKYSTNLAGQSYEIKKVYKPIKTTEGLNTKIIEKYVGNIKFVLFYDKSIGIKINI